MFPPLQIRSVSAGYTDLRLTTTGNRQTLVNAQSARMVNLGSVGTHSAQQVTQWLKSRRIGDPKLPSACCSARLGGHRTGM